MSPQIPEHRYFFIHIMKTAGTSLWWHLARQVDRRRMYPYREATEGPGNYDHYTRIDKLLALPPAEIERMTAITGHFPFVVTDLLGGNFRTLTVVRDPVDRTISYLKHCANFHPQHRDLPLEEIYEDAFYFPCFMHNHQSKVYAMTPDDKLETIMDVIEVDDRRLEIAKANLARVDVIGITERFDEMLEELTVRWGWTIDELDDRRVSGGSWEISDTFRRRIADDNQADMEFYAYATELQASRRDQLLRR